MLQHAVQRDELRIVTLTGIEVVVDVPDRLAVGHADDVVVTHDAL